MLKNYKKYKNILENIIFVNQGIKNIKKENICTVFVLQIPGLFFIKCCEDGHRKMMKIPVTNL